MRNQAFGVVMKSIGTLAVFVLLVSTNVFAAPVSFQQWKTRRVAEKMYLLTQLKRERALPTDIHQAKVSQAQFNLQTEKDLTPEDYFHLYLFEQFKTNPENAKETAKSLSKAELADIVVSYISATKQFRAVEATASRLQTSR